MKLVEDIKMRVSLVMAPSDFLEPTINGMLKQVLIHEICVRYLVFCIVHNPIHILWSKVNLSSGLYLLQLVL